MPSEHRLHPSSFVFAVAGQLRSFLVPGLAVLFTAGATGAEWEVGAMALVVPIAGFSLLRCLSYRYRLDESELVVRTGFIFRNERHIPYARIQNVDVIQSVFHRLLDVVEVRIETGATDEDDAVMRVVKTSAYRELRESVFAERTAAQVDSAAAADGGSVLLTLPAHELLLSGLIANRSAVLIAAAFGVGWELGLFDFVFGRLFGGRLASLRELARAVFTQSFSLWYILLAVGLLLALFAAVTAVSMVWSLVRLYGFTLRRRGDDLVAQYGLLTRISTTIPIRRIQTLTVFEGPLYRACKRARVRVTTAGGEAGEQNAALREPLAPIIRRDELPAFLSRVLPEIDVGTAEWQPAAPRAFVRELRQSAVVAAVVSGLFVALLGSWTLLLFGALLALSFLHARRYVATLGWALVDNAVVFKRGWLWRRITAARFSKMQTVALHQSPFDRRHVMARVQVDTAGGSGDADSVNIPYLHTSVAQTLHGRLAVEASRTTFEW